MFKFITHRPLWANILAAIAIALIIFFIFIFSLNWLTHHNQAMSVPYVQGKNFEEAKSALEKAGFEVVVQDSLYIDTAKPLSVLKQVPEAEELVKVNRTVYLTINRAVPPDVEMPNLIGYSYRSAEMALKNANLRVGDTTFRPDFAKNAVLEQRYNGHIIRPGDKVRMGSTIALVLGDGVGDRQFPVPVLIGLTYCEAKTLAEAQGITIGSVIPKEDVTDTCNAYIYWQRPERFDEDKKFRYIRSGQMIDIRLQKDKPEADTSIVPPADGE
ncbi:PASTA domain-containing protein [Terrimonas sp. NA20]|uniref:PASTA domain-containing protein n=1 Tax=Terrimonas ginsenosidimutans TaxID=2908004 RepID=A0ABS9KTG2_9BACT|nr:PASTA domain-containing protein [Terrimonas ginsenosidimutans]MCG2615622.1 PASTA domain-containing protein [Terrimonas ginsenosidimutans]